MAMLKTAVPITFGFGIAAPNDTKLSENCSPPKQKKKKLRVSNTTKQNPFLIKDHRPFHELWFIKKDNSDFKISLCNEHALTGVIYLLLIDSETTCKLGMFTINHTRDIVAW